MKHYALNSMRMALPLPLQGEAIQPHRETSGGRFEE